MTRKQTLLPADRLSVPVQLIERRIYLIRGHKIMLDSDLAELYGVSTKVFNQAVKRNRNRFPHDFMFQTTVAEANSLRSQIVTSNHRRGGRRYRAYAFTEQGVAMLSSVLTSNRAVQVNIAIMRAFVRFRELLGTHKELAHRMDHLERKQREQGAKIETVFRAIQKLLEPPVKKARPIGFAPEVDR
jgi:phage regulator Rha-like protein